MIEDRVEILRSRLRKYVISSSDKTMVDIAKEIGISSPTFTSFLRCKGAPSIRTVLRVDNFLKDKNV